MSAAPGHFLALAGDLAHPAAGPVQIAKHRGYRELWRNETTVLLGLGPMSVSARRPDVGRAVVVGTLVAPVDVDEIASAADDGDGSFCRWIRDRLSGHWAVVVTRGSTTMVVCDHLGTVPIHEASTDRGRVVGTHLHDVARCAELTTLDPTSMDEFLRDGIVTWPYTMIDGVTRLEPGALTRLEGSASGRVTGYWRPEQGPEPTDLREAAVAASVALDGVLRDVVRCNARIGLLYSGGEDSRVLARRLRLLGCGSGRLDAYIFLDRPNREYRLARTAARLMGVSVHLRPRSPDHYARQVPDGIEQLGVGYDLHHSHSPGLIGPNEADVFLDGWSADTAFKGYLLKRQVSEARDYAAGRRRRPPRVAHEAYLGPKRPFVERRRAKLAVIGEFRRPESEILWALAWPASDRRSFGFFHSNRHSRPSISPYTTPAVIDTVASITERAKYEGDFFWRAFTRSLGPAGFVPRSGGELPGLPARLCSAAAPVTAAAFRGFDALANRRGSARNPGPWPTHGQLRDSILPLAEALDPDARRVLDSMRQRSRRGELPGETTKLFRYVQLGSLLEIGEFTWSG